VGGVLHDLLPEGLGFPDRRSLRHSWPTASGQATADLLSEPEADQEKETSLGPL